MTIGDDFSSEAIAISTGKAENEIVADGFTLKDVAPFFDNLKHGRLDPKKLTGAKFVPEQDRVAALADLLLGLPADKADIDALNAYLAEQGSRVALKKS